MPNLKSRLRSLWRDHVRVLLCLVLLLGSFRSAIADWNDVPSGSMKPTLLEGDRIYVNKLAYDLRLPFTELRVARWGAPARGDVVVFFSPEDGRRMVKRVVGVPGDRVALRRNRLFVNGTPADYEPLEPEVSRALAPSERQRHVFARETLGGTSHPVMATSRLPSQSSFGPVSVPPGHYFMLGDNRDNSHDSRWFGFVEWSAIVGRVPAVALSVDPQRHYRPRWERFFSSLP